MGDEQCMLDAALNTGDLSKVELIANPDRVAAAAATLGAIPASICLFSTMRSSIAGRAATWTSC